MMLVKTRGQYGDTFHKRASSGTVYASQGDRRQMLALVSKHDLEHSRVIVRRAELVAIHDIAFE